jgi:hypothetical protein
MTFTRSVWCCCCLLAISAPAVYAAESGNLRAGAARIDITPAKEPPLPMSGYAGRGPHQGIRDNIFVRAIVLDDGSSRAAIVACEVIGFPEPVWDEVAGCIAKETGIPRENILLAGVHTHEAPSPALVTSDMEPGRAAYLRKLYDSIVDAARRATRMPSTGRARTSARWTSWAASSERRRCAWPAK